MPQAGALYQVSARTGRGAGGGGARPRRANSHRFSRIVRARAAFLPEIHQGHRRRAAGDLRRRGEPLRNAPVGQSLRGTENYVGLKFWKIPRQRRQNIGFLFQKIIDFQRLKAVDRKKLKFFEKSY